MKCLVVYDTSYGNTSKIAAAIAKGFGPDGRAIEVEKLHDDDVAGVSLLIVGSPTQGGRPTSSIRSWLETLSVEGVSGAAFDTRLDGPWLKRTALDLVGYAAPRVGRLLRKRGLALVDEPQGFLVSAGEGPLVAGELERAEAWGARLREIAKAARIDG